MIDGHVYDIRYAIIYDTSGHKLPIPIGLLNWLKEVLGGTFFVNNYFSSIIECLGATDKVAQ